MHCNAFKSTKKHWIVSLFVKTLLDRCGQTWFARPFFKSVLRRAWLRDHTTSPSTPQQCTAMHCNALQCIQIHQINKALFLSEIIHCILVDLNALQCLAVYCRGGWRWGSVISKPCSPQNSWKKWPSNSGLATVVQQSFEKSDTIQCILVDFNALQCIAVHCWGLRVR